MTIFNWCLAVFRNYDFFLIINLFSWKKRVADILYQWPFRTCVMFVDLRLPFPKWLVGLWLQGTRVTCVVKCFKAPRVFGLQNKLLSWTPHWYKLLAQMQVSPTQISSLGRVVCFQPGYVFQWNPRAACQNGLSLCRWISSDKQINAGAALGVPHSLLYVTAIIPDIKPVGQDPLHGCLSYICMHLHPHAHIHITYTCATELALPLFPLSLIWPCGKATLVRWHSAQD